MADLESSAKAEVSLSTHWTNKAREAKVVVNKWSATVLAEPSTPYQEHKTPKCCTFCRIASICLSIVFGWIVVFTFLKIPYMPSQKYYTNATYNLTEHPECYEPWNHPECYGPQGNVNVMAWESNFQGVQLVTDYSLFIGPHTVMSIALECLFIAFLVRGWSSAVPLGDAIVPLAALFALHVAPVGYGMPSLYLNWACILIIWSGCVIARWGRETIRNPSKANEEDEVRLGNKMLFVGLVMIICAVNTAPFAEFAFLAGTRVLNETTGETAGAAWAQTREDHPLAASGHGVYAGCQCPGFGWIVTFGLLGYLILTGAIYVYRWSSLSREGCIADLEKSALARSADASAETTSMVNKKLGGRGWYKCVKFFCQFRLRVLWARINRGSALCQLARYTEGKDERETFPQDGMMKGIIRPDVYLEAYFEMFIITMAVSWTLTLMYNPNVLASNRLKDMVGYNNLCVGFDTEPARTVATPLFALMAYFGIRYVALDGIIAEMRSRDHRKAFSFTPGMNKWKQTCKFAFGMLCLALPMLLVITPTSNLAQQPQRDDLTMHFGIFVVFILVTWVMILIKFIEASHLTFYSKLWFGYFSFLTWGVMILGRTSVGSYDFVKCPTEKRGDALVYTKDGYYPWPDLLGDDICVQEPAIPPGLLGFFDFSWFGMLILTTGFLPDGPSIQFQYRLHYPQTSTALKKAKAAALTIARANISQRKGLEQKGGEGYSPVLATGADISSTAAPATTTTTAASSSSKAPASGSKPASVVVDVQKVENV